MEENFKKIIEEIKESEMDPEVIKKYILAIKRVVRKDYENCRDEESKEDILDGFLEEYERDLTFRGNAPEICNNILMYNAYSRILQNYKGNKSAFDATIREAKKKELEDNEETIMISRDSKERMVSAIRHAIRNRSGIKEKEIVQLVQNYKGVLDQPIRENLINIIHSSIRFLEEYGFIDEYIEESNKSLVELGLPQLQYEKRNPIPDEQYDGNGNLVTDVEDIGVIDAFEKENLEKLPIEDLEFMAAVWESRYLEERMNISRAMAVIKSLGLWDMLLEGEDIDVEKIPDERIESGLKKDLALTYLCRNDCKITSRMKRQYKKFLKNEDMDTEVELEEEIQDTFPEMANLQATTRDIAALNRLIMYQLKEKDIKPKRWGVAGTIQENEGDPEELLVVIESKNFRGPLVMGVYREVLEQLLGEGVKLPRYEKEINNKYSQVMSKLYLPITKYFTDLISKVYQENPSSEFIADLAGKKTRATGEGR